MILVCVENAKLIYASAIENVRFGQIISSPDWAGPLIFDIDTNVSISHINGTEPSDAEKKVFNCKQFD